MQPDLYLRRSYKRIFAIGPEDLAADLGVFVTPQEAMVVDDISPQAKAYWCILDAFQKIDARRGVTSRFYRSQEDDACQSELFYCRDASGTLTPDDEQCNKLSYMVMGINYAIACMDLFEAYLKENAVAAGDPAQNDAFIRVQLAEIESLLAHYCTAAESTTNPEAFFVGFVEHCLATKLSEYNLPGGAHIADDDDDAVKKLDSIQKYANLSIPAYRLVTRTRHERKDPRASAIHVIQDEQPVLGLHAALAEEYNSAEDVDADNPDWYEHMSTADQLVFRHVHHRNMMQADRVLSPQHRDGGIAGPKNAFISRCTAFDATDGTVLKSFAALRHGAQPTVTPGVDDEGQIRTAQLSMQTCAESLDASFGRGAEAVPSRVDISILLNTKSADLVLGCCLPGLVDRKIVRSTERAMAQPLPLPQQPREDGDIDDPLLGEEARNPRLMMNTPVNGFRRFEGLGLTRAVMTSIDQCVDRADHFANKIIALPEDQVEDDFKTEMLNLQNHLLKMLTDFSGRQFRWRCARDKNVNPVYVIADLVDISNTIEAIRVLGEDNIDAIQGIDAQNAEAGLEETFNAVTTFNVWYGCASGENRTGLVTLSCHMQSILNSFGVDEFPTQESFIANGHVIVAMGMTTARQGMRYKSSETHPNNAVASPKGRKYNPIAAVDEMFTRQADIKGVWSMIRPRENTCSQRLSAILSCCGMFSPPPSAVLDRYTEPVMHALMLPVEALAP